MSIKVYFNYWKTQINFFYESLLHKSISRLQKYVFALISLGDFDPDIFALIYYVIKLLQPLR